MPFQTNKCKQFGILALMEDFKKSKVEEYGEFSYVEKTRKFENERKTS